MIVKSASLMVSVDDVDEMLIKGDGNNAGSFKIRVRAVTTWYTWDRLVGYWRVEQSTVTGDPRSKACPDVVTFPHGDPGKPLWLVVIEHTNHPKEKMFR